MKRILVCISIGVIVVVIAVLVGKNVIAKAVVRGAVKAMTNLDLRIDRMDVGLLRSAIGVYGLELRNPEGFEDSIMMRMPELYVDYDLRALLRGEVHLETVRVHLEEFIIVKNQAGEINLDALKVVQASKEPDPAARAKQKREMPNVQLDALDLKVGMVVYRDYSRGTPPKVREFVVNIDEHYENISDWHLIAGLIVTRALVKTTIARLSGLDLGALQGQVGEQLARARGLAGAAAIQATETARTVATRATDAGLQAMGTAQDTIQGAGEALKKLNPFVGE